MFARIFLGYRDGTPLPTAYTGGPLYGNLLSEPVRGVMVVRMWPHDFPISAKNEASQPLAALWRPQMSVVLEGGFAITGLECVPAGGKPRWLAQRWMVEPITFADIKAIQDAAPRFGQNTPRASSNRSG